MSSSKTQSLRQTKPETVKSSGTTNKHGNNKKLVNGSSLKSSKSTSCSTGDTSANQTQIDLKFATMSELKLTKPAPEWSGMAVTGGEFKTISLSDYKGKYLVFFFYPLDFTFVCPTEIISFSDRVEEFRAINCEVVACSTDSHFSHLAWVNTPRKQGGLGDMNIPLLADKTQVIAQKYGVLKEDEGVAFRGLFIIDDKGNLRQITINDLPVGRSVDETLRLVQAFQFTDKHGEDIQNELDIPLHSNDPIQTDNSCAQSHTRPPEDIQQSLTIDHINNKHLLSSEITEKQVEIQDEHSLPPNVAKIVELSQENVPKPARKSLDKNMESPKAFQEHTESSELKRDSPKRHSASPSVSADGIILKGYKQTEANYNSPNVVITTDGDAEKNINNNVEHVEQSKYDFTKAASPKLGNEARPCCQCV